MDDQSLQPGHDPEAQPSTQEQQPPTQEAQPPMQEEQPPTQEEQPSAQEAQPSMQEEQKPPTLQYTFEPLFQTANTEKLTLFFSDQASSSQPQPTAPASVEPPAQTVLFKPEQQLSLQPLNDPLNSSDEAQVSEWSSS